MLAVYVVSSFLANPFLLANLLFVHWILLVI
jgi:hypothetical protein